VQEKVRLTIRLFFVLTVLAVARGAPAQGTTLPGPPAAATSRWNREAAAAYLDQRMDEWFARGKNFKQAPARRRAFRATP
jgi:hypothetical protein